jgi:hypothetical protein
VPPSNQQRRRLPALRHDAQVDLALARLARFARLEREYGGQLNDAGLRLLRASAFSAYCDCRSLGIADRADAALRDGREDAANVGETAPAAPVGAAS